LTRYRTIVADPPWKVKAGPAHFADNPNRARTGPATRDLSYGTMTVDEIAALRVTDIAEKDAHLYLWAINAYVEDAYNVARAWGFKPSALLTWCKTPRGIGLGGTFTLTTEPLLFCRRGTCKALSRSDTSWFQWPRGRHSEKPDAFYDLVEATSPGPYLEMFARRARLGDWHYWGNESLGTVRMPGEEAA
jgi:N6-adenosine-specific RNA methylase IME4